MNRERAQSAALSVGFGLGRAIPRRAVAPTASLLSGVALRAGFVDTTGWRANAARVLGRPPRPREERQAIAYYTRYFVEMLALTGWGQRDIAASVRIDPVAFAALRADLEGPGAVLALGHLGNWDLAGAWAAQHGLPVTSVAEQLPGRAFAQFLRHREGLGMRIYGHRQPGVVGQLVADARAHRLVCLLGDRDLRGHGIGVRWPLRDGSAPVTLPAGPSVVAQRSGAVLRALALRYDGPSLVFDFSGPIDVAPGQAGLAAASQQIADHLGAAVARDVTQWHVLQPFFDRGAGERA